MHLGPFLLSTIVMAQPGSAATTHEVVAVGNDRHLWFAAEAAGEGFDLCHVARDAQPPVFTRMMSLRESPTALACWGEQVWVTFAPLDEANPNGREVFTTTVQRNEALRIDYPSPAGRLDMAPALPAGRLVGLVGTAQGPVALIINSQATSLVQLRGSEWTRLDLPEAPAFQPSLLAASGSQGSRLTILGSASGAESALAFQRESDGSWTVSEVPVEPSRINRLLSGQDQLIATITGRAGDDLEIAYVRPPLLMPLATIAPPTGPWSLASFGGDLALLERSRDSGFLLRRIDGLTGKVMSPQPLAAQELPKGRLWLLLGSLIVGLAAVFAAQRLRAKRGSIPSLPATLEVLPLGSRFIAAMLDLLPAAAIAALSTGTPINQLWLPPFAVLGLDQTVPYLMMVGLMALHTTASELMTATTFGKSMVGARVSTLNGARPSAAQVLVRAGFKIVVLLIPPLVLVATGNRHSQGIDDLAAATVVVRDAQMDDPINKP